jgi:hypothetical protein
MGSLTVGTTPGTPPATSSKRGSSTNLLTLRWAFASQPSFSTALAMHEPRRLLASTSLSAAAAQVRLISQLTVI